MRKELSEFVEEAKKGKKKRVVVAASEDTPVLKAVRDAVQEGLVDAILVGSKQETESMMDQIGFDSSQAEIITAGDPEEAVLKR